MTADRVLQSVPRVAAWLAIALGAMVLVGWALDAAALRTVLPGSVAMMANTAVALMLAGAALGLSRRSGGRVAAAALLLIGSTTLIEYIGGWDLHVDQLLFSDPDSPLRAPGRMAFTTAASFVVLGTALFLVSSKKSRARRIAEILAGIGALFVLFEIEGYLLGAAPPVGYTPMALPTALALAVLCIGTIAAVPDSWLIARATDAGPGGILMRRLLPVAIGLPLALGVLGKAGEAAGWLDALGNIWLMVMLTMLLLIATGVWSVAAVERVGRTLRETEELFRSFFEESPIGVLITGVDGKLLRANPAVTAMLGYSPAELVSLSWTDITHPDDLAPSKEAVRVLISREAERWELEKRYRAKDGRWVWARNTIGVHRGADGKIIHFLAHIQDITDSRQAAERLQHRERQLAAAQAIAHVGSWEWNIVTNVVTWSDELRRIFGVAADAPAGYHEFLAVAHDDDRARLEAMVADALQTHRTVDYEWRVVRPDGTLRYLQARNVVITGPNGHAIRMAGTSVDVTEHKRAEQALINSERYYRALIDQATDITTLVDADGFIRYASPSNEYVLGYKPDELVGQRVFELVHPDDLATTLDVFADGSSVPGAIRRLEFRFRHRNGSWRVLSAVGRSLFDDPVIKAGIINARDVTEQKLAEEHERTLLRELQQAMSEVKVLEGILPICASCKRIRDGGGKWEPVESYVRAHTNAEFTHGLCPDCAARDWGARAETG